MSMDNSVSKHYEQMKWIIARAELADENKRGSLSYQKPKSSSTFDMHERVSGLHLGLRSANLPDVLSWLKSIRIDMYDYNHFEEKIQDQKRCSDEELFNYSKNHHLSFRSLLVSL